MIAKADGLSVSELATFRTSIRSTLEHHGVHVYMPKDPECKGTYEASFPLAVVASRDVVVVGGTSMRVRQYPWGMVEGEHNNHEADSHFCTTDMLIQSKFVFVDQYVCPAVCLAQTHKPHKRTRLTLASTLAGDVVI